MELPKELNLKNKTLRYKNVDSQVYQSLQQT